MATKSILKTVSIRDRRSARALANALVHAKSKKGRKPKLSAECHEMSKEEIRQMFGAAK